MLDDAVAFRFSLQRRPSGVGFRGCIPGLPVPLSTLRGRPRMTRGRCGSLTLHRMTLSLTTPRRFNPAHKEEPMSSGSAKQKILEVIEKLPADATLEDAIERLVLLAKTERGLAELDAGQGVDHAEAKRRLLR
jgi:hypothetical protein